MGRAGAGRMAGEGRPGPAGRMGDRGRGDGAGGTGPEDRSGEAEAGRPKPGLWRRHGGRVGWRLRCEKSAGGGPDPGGRRRRSWGAPTVEFEAGSLRKNRRAAARSRWAGEPEPAERGNPDSRVGRGLFGEQSAGGSPGPEGRGEPGRPAVRRKIGRPESVSRIRPPGSGRSGTELLGRPEGRVGRL